MDIIKHLENAKAQIKAEADRECAIVIEKAKREKIIPFNQDIDKDKAETIAKLNQAQMEEKAKITETYNLSLVKLQEKYDGDRKIIVDLAEKKKADNESAVLATETYPITKDCDKAIAKLDAQIAELTKE